MDNALLNREINRMQEIDRLKVNHAKDVFYNPDTGSVLPSLDTCHASTSEGGLFLAHAPSHAATPPPHLLGGSTGQDRLQDYGSTCSARDVVTQNELKGVCERLSHKPSRRQRIIIARSQDPTSTIMRQSGPTLRPLAGADTERSNYKEQMHRPKLGSLDQRALEEMSRTIHFKNDSKMSIQEGVVQKHGTSKAGPFTSILNQNSQTGTVRPPFVGSSPHQKHSQQYMTSRPDLQGKQSPASVREHEVATLSHLHQQSHSNDISQELPSLPPPASMNTIGDDQFHVHLQTPGIPNAIERIKARQSEKKHEKAVRQKRMEE